MLVIKIAHGVVRQHVIRVICPLDKTRDVRTKKKKKKKKIVIDLGNYSTSTSTGL